VSTKITNNAYLYTVKGDVTGRRYEMTVWVKREESYSKFQGSVGIHVYYCRDWRKPCQSYAWYSRELILGVFLHYFIVLCVINIHSHNLQYISYEIRLGRENLELHWSTSFQPITESCRILLSYARHLPRSVPLSTNLIIHHWIRPHFAPRS
jgi:hypothetical protein